MDKDEMEFELRRSRDRLTRQRRKLRLSVKRQHELVREALRLGVRPIHIAKATGLSAQRIWQISKDGGDADNPSA